ncbi:bifunctional UDP-N-acetylglucosamine diphosphorylase/glucosamine-1-phosphate N-acetyltransferase GlmU [Streptomyces heliomycini]
MKSATPKVLHDICGRSLVGHVLAAAGELEPEHLVVVVGHAREKVTAHLAEIAPDVRTAVQAEQNGTGHAVRMGLEELGGSVDGTVVVVCGDTPLLTGETLRRLSAAHVSDGNAVTVLTAEVPDATGYGRIVRDDSGAVTAIVEHKDASEAQRAVREINSGVFAFDGALLADALKRVRTDNSQGEEYLTDVLGILRGAGHRVGASVAGDHREIAGINNRVQLSEARRVLNDRLLTEAMLSGVTVVDPASSTWVDVSVTFEQDVVVLPGTQLHGVTHLAEGCEVGPNTRLTDTRVGAGARVDNAVAVGSEVGPGASVGPYAYLRPGSRLGRGAKVGTYVETKNASIGEGSKVPHLSYVGDATIGEFSNIGAASVFVNYDGQDKHHTTVGSHCRTVRTTCLWRLSRSGTVLTRLPGR